MIGSDFIYTPIRSISNEKFKNRFFVFSKRLNREIRLYNELEYDHWITVESDLSVQSYCEKPLWIITSLFGKPIKSLIDMWILYENGNEVFINIKRSKDIIECNTMNSITKELYAQRKWALENDKSHQLFTEKEIRFDIIKLSNQKLLMPYLVPLPQLSAILLQDILNEVKQSNNKIQNIIQKLNHFHSHTVKEAIFNLIHYQYLRVYDNTLINSQSEVYINDTKTISGFSTNRQ